MVFCEVAQKGSFTEAAKSLGISKSAVSQQITKLEQSVGHQLITRNTRGVSLSAIGQKILARSVLLKEQVDLIYEELAVAGENPSGRFSVTLPHSMEKNIVIPAISQLCKEFPDILPVLDITDKPKDLIQDKLDVAIFIGDLKDSNYRALPIGSIKEEFYATPGYLKEHGEPMCMDDLFEHRWIGTGWQGNRLSYYEDRVGAERQEIDIRPSPQLNTSSCALNFALQDMGVVLLPNVLAEEWVQEGSLVHVLTPFRGPLWPIYFVHSFQNEKPVHVARFYQLVKQHFNEVLEGC
ncbi:MAG: LysR family transcriptional regulator [Moraxellaceae bacterium]|nr:MAG: LysR family transcriptional regulator [Moraxellaceae bacterium]